MKQWGLAIISIGGILIMTSQTMPNDGYLLIVTGISVVIGGVIMFRKGNTEDKK